jgi:hypothetical protein
MAFSMHRGSDLRRRAAARNKRTSAASQGCTGIQSNRTLIVFIDTGTGRILKLKGGDIFGSHSPLGHPRSLILSAALGEPSSSSTAQPTAANIALKKACKEDLAKSFVKWQDITTTFEEFPYFIEYVTVARVFPQLSWMSSNRHLLFAAHMAVTIQRRCCSTRRSCSSRSRN